LPTIIFFASRRAKSSTSFADQIVDQNDIGGLQRPHPRASVSNSGSPGPAPTSTTEPVSLDAPCLSLISAAMSLAVGAPRGLGDRARGETLPEAPSLGER